MKAGCGRTRLEPNFSGRNNATEKEREEERNTYKCLKAFMLSQQTKSIWKH